MGALHVDITPPLNSFLEAIRFRWIEEEGPLDGTVKWRGLKGRW